MGNIRGGATRDVTEMQHASMARVAWVNHSADVIGYACPVTAGLVDSQPHGLVGIEERRVRLAASQRQCARCAWPGKAGINRIPCQVHPSTQFAEPLHVSRCEGPVRGDDAGDRSTLAPRVFADNPDGMLEPLQFGEPGLQPHRHKLCRDTQPLARLDQPGQTIERSGGDACLALRLGNDQGSVDPLAQFHDIGSSSGQRGECGCVAISGLQPRHGGVQCGVGDVALVIDGGAVSRCHRTGGVQRAYAAAALDRQMPRSGQQQIGCFVALRGAVRERTLIGHRQRLPGNRRGQQHGQDANRTEQGEPKRPRDPVEQGLDPYALR